MGGPTGGPWPAHGDAAPSRGRHFGLQGLRQACAVALKHLDEVSIGIDESDPAARRTLLERCAGTALNSKLIASHKVRPPGRERGARGAAAAPQRASLFRAALGRSSFRAWWWTR